MPSLKLFIFLHLAIFSTLAPAKHKAYPRGSLDSSLSSHIEARSSPSGKSFKYDVVIYGTSPGAITAAIQVKRMGKTVAIVTPDEHLGGLTSSGLGWTDSKNGKGQIGGIAQEFYIKVFQYYEKDTAWTSEKRDEYSQAVSSAQPGPAIDKTNSMQYTFEPKVAESIFTTWVKDGKIPVHSGESLDRSESGVQKSGPKIQSFRTESGKVFSGLQFIDAGYEGDLMKAAGISCTVGRESSSTYNEDLNGMRIKMDDSYDKVDPYKTKGKSDSGLLSGVQDPIPSPLPKGFTGSKDPLRVMSFNYRLCLTQSKDNKVPLTKPDDYDESEFELLLRVLEAGHEASFTHQGMPNHKTDSNSQGLVSFDLVGGNLDHKTPYSEASYDERKKMIAQHKKYQQGVLWTLANHPRVPEDQRKKNAEWGLAKDEFTSNGNWPYAIYIREARRMIGEYVFKQSDVENRKVPSGDIAAGLGAYSMDNHVIRRIVYDSKIYDEGYFYHKTSSTPYPIPYKSLVPKKNDATNFLNPVTISATHVGFSSMRMEPTYMILGQTAGTAAVMAIEQKVAVQDIDKDKLKQRLLKDKQKLSA
ncbi:MAG: hypothetical protein M1820_004357 [Bogoriella megaspora]|nr:MAG: hypothetical protein M1820_004357 [Bogoriella megaspora]